MHAPAPLPRLLPFLEQQPLYNALNWSLPVINDPNASKYGPYANSTVTITRLDAFLCPSDTPPSWNLSSASQPLPSYRRRGTTISPSLGSSLEFTSRQTGGPPNGPLLLRRRDRQDRGHPRRHGRHEQHDRLRRMEDRRRQLEPRLGPQRHHLRRVICPPGRRGTTGRCNMPNPILVANFPAWVQSAPTVQTADDGRTTPSHSARPGSSTSRGSASATSCWRPTPSPPIAIPPP